MDTVTRFIEDAKNKDISVSTLLLEAKSLARQLQQPDVLGWITNEIDGYSKNHTIPEFRKVTGKVKGWNPVHGWVSVIHTGTTEFESQLTTRKPVQSIAQIESLISSNSDTFEMPIPSSVSDKILKGDLKTSLSLFVDKTSLVGILEVVRSRLLDWGLTLRELGITGDSQEVNITKEGELQEINAMYSFGKIEHFHGNIGSNATSSENSYIRTPAESFWSKVFWYVVVALFVVIIGNIVSAGLVKFLAW